MRNGLSMTGENMDKQIDRKKKILEQEYGIKFQTKVEKNSSCSID